MKAKKTPRALGRLLMLVFAMLASWSTNAMAEGSGTKGDPYILQDGGTYQEIAYKDFYAKFTVPADVTTDDVYLVINNVRSKRFFAYSNAEMTQEIDLENCFHGYNPWMLKIAVPQGTAAGTTYYFHTWSMDRNTLTVEYGKNAGQIKPAAIERISPADGSTLSAANCNIYLTFTRDVLFDDVIMDAAGQNFYPTVNDRGRYISFEPKETLMGLYQNGSLKAGDPITVTLTNVRDADGLGEIGDIKINYTAARKPLMLTGTVNTPGKGLDVILSYMPTSSPEGLVQLQFDGPLLADDPDRNAVIAYGNIESEGEYYREELPVSLLDDHTLAIDLRGKLRTPQTMEIASGKTYDNMSLTVRGVKDIDGNYAYSDNNGSLGKFNFVYTYGLFSGNLFPDYEYTHEFTPASGQSIDGVESIELYLREEGGAHLAYTGANFAYTYKGMPATTTVDAALFDVQPDPEDENALLINIPVPEFSRDANSTVTVSLAGLETPDGVDHSADFTVTYTTKGTATAEKGVTSAVMTLKDGQTTIDLLLQNTLEKLPADAKLTVATSFDAEAGLMEYSLYDTTAGEIVKSYYNTDKKNSAGHWDFYIPADYTLYKGHTYELRFEAWATVHDRNTDQPSIGYAVVTLEGLTKSYEYSDVKLISPEELYYDQGEANFVLDNATNNTIQFVFSAPVTIQEAFVPLGPSGIQSCTVQMSGDGCTANVTIPANVLENFSLFTVNILAKDGEGRVVKGNYGENEASYIAVYVDAKFNLPMPTLVSPAENAEVKEITSLRFSFDKGIQPSWTGDPITIYTKSREVVATSTDVVSIIPDEHVDDWDYVVTEVEVSLSNPVTESGTYVIKVPEGFFNLDLSNNGYKLISNHECFFTVQVVGEEEPVLTELNCTIDPEPGKVSALSSFNITFNDFETCTWTYDAYPVFTDDQGAQVEVTDLDYGDNWNLLNQLKCTLPKPYTAEGIYTLTIPAGAVTYNDDPDKVNPVAVTFEYAIGRGDSIAAILSGRGEQFDVYTPDGRCVRRNAKAESLRTLPAGAYVINGLRVILR